MIKYLLAGKDCSSSPMVSVSKLPACYGVVFAWKCNDFSIKFSVPLWAVFDSAVQSVCLPKTWEQHRSFDFFKSANMIVNNNKKELCKWKHRRGRNINLTWRWEAGNPGHQSSTWCPFSSTQCDWVDSSPQHSTLTGSSGLPGAVEDHKGHCPMQTEWDGQALSRKVVWTNEECPWGPLAQRAVTCTHFPVSLPTDITQRHYSRD